MRPRRVTGETKYGTVQNIAGIEHEQTRAVFPLSAVGQRAGDGMAPILTGEFIADAPSEPSGSYVHPEIPLPEGLHEPIEVLAIHVAL